MAATMRPTLRRPASRAAIAAAAAVLVLVAALAALDPSGGLLAPVGGHGLPLLGCRRRVPLGTAGGGAARSCWPPPPRRSTPSPASDVGRVGVRRHLGRHGRRRRLAAAATGLVAALPLVGPHLSFGSALQFAVTTSGWAGLKGLVVGPLVALAAVLAHRFGPRTAADAEPAPGRGATRIAVAVVLAVVALAAVWPSPATAWRGGPVGYAFAGPLVAPTRRRGVAGHAGRGRGVRRRLLRSSGAARVTGARPRRWRRRGLAGRDRRGPGRRGGRRRRRRAVSSDLPDAGPDSWWIATEPDQRRDRHRVRRWPSACSPRSCTAVAWRWRSRLPRRRTRGPGSLVGGVLALVAARGAPAGRGARRGRAAGRSPPSRRPAGWSASPCCPRRSRAGCRSSATSPGGR